MLGVVAERNTRLTYDGSIMMTSSHTTLKEKGEHTASVTADFTLVSLPPFCVVDIMNLENPREESETKYVANCPAYLVEYHVFNIPYEIRSSVEHRTKDFSLQRNRS